MRVGIADDSTLFRRGLNALLTAMGFTVTIEATDGVDLVRQVERELPDAVILDIRMSPTFSEEGLDTADELRLRYPSLGILVLSTYAETHYAVKLFRRGNRGIGYLLKDRVDDVHTLGEALRRVVAGGCVVDPDIVTDLFAQQTMITSFDRLSPRERDVLRLMAEGRSNIGIAQETQLSPKTVEKHVAAVFTKLNLSTAADDNRRVIAVLTWLRAIAKQSAVHDRDQT